MSYRHECPLRPSIRCVSGPGKPRSPKCPVCSSTLLVHEGRWGVFVWTAANRYPESAAVRIFEQHAAAEKTAAATTDLVVRWVPKEAS